LAQSILLQHPSKTQFLGGPKKFSVLCADSVPPTLTAGFRPCGGPVTRGTDSWLHDTDSHKNFCPDLLLKVLMLNMHKIWSFD